MKKLKISRLTPDSRYLQTVGLKWFHSFGLGNGANPLDSSICHNLLEAARHDKPVSVKKEPISTEIIETIIDKVCWSFC